MNTNFASNMETWVKMLNEGRYTACQERERD